jgi:hypothetical protein
MALCTKPSEDQDFVVTRLFRNSSPQHFAFVGAPQLKEHKEILQKIGNGKSITATEEKRLEKSFTKKTINLLKKVSSKGEKVHFVPDRIWLDDSVYQIKIKIFVYLSNPNTRKFLLPQNQQLWSIVNDKDIVLGVEFIREIQAANGHKTFSYPMSYPPALESDKPEIDKEFLTPDGERTSDIQATNRESDILYDFLRERGDPTNVQRIFLYMLGDEIEWYKEQDIEEAGKNQARTSTGSISKRAWNGYFLKQWPFADTDVSISQIVRMYKEVEIGIKATAKVIDSVKEGDLDPNPKLKSCVAWQLIIWSRLMMKKDSRPFRMDMTYSFLRNFLSMQIPFIYYTSHKDKKPYISVFNPAIDSGSITGNQLREWVFAKGTTGQYIPREKRGIVLKLFLYKGDSGTKYQTVQLLPNGDVSISITFEESKGANLTDIEQAVQKVTNLTRMLNEEFLSKQGSPTFPVPEFRIEGDRFILGSMTHIQYFNVITTFSYKKEIEFDKLLKFSRQYQPFAEPSVLTQVSKDMTELILKYRRISKSTDLPAIFEFIEKERLMGSAPEATVEAIIRRFGKSKQEANEAYRHYRVMKEDPQSARRLIRESGVNMAFKRDENFSVTKSGKTTYNYKIFLSGLSSLFILRNCYQFLQHFINSFYHPSLAPEKKATQILMEKGIEFDFGYAQDNVVDAEIAATATDVEVREPVSEEEELALSNFNIENINLNKNAKEKRRAEFSSTGTIDLRDESNADPTVRLRCSTEQNKIADKGTCKNVCDDLRFKLRRLQQFEPRIFHFPHLRGKNQPYSRQCDDPRRPIVMAYDPATNPKIDKDAFTYAIKYRSSNTTPYYYYICPQAWCPICEMPIALSKLKTRKTVRTKRGECEFGICPNGNHQVYINVKGKDNVYPGFIDPGGNPEGLCMPCCFKIFSKNTPTYKRCTKGEVGASNIAAPEEEDQGWKYINRQDKVPLQEGRFGLLSAEVEAFLGQSGCKNGTIKQGFDCLVRKGVKPSPERSFVYAIADLVSGIIGAKITEPELRKRLVTKLSPQLFLSLNAGRVKRIFGSIDKFKQYLQAETGPLPDTYLWDFVSRPGVFSEEGFNLVIFTPHSIYCPMGQNPWELYSLEKPTALIIKFGTTYEPIYRIQNPDGQPRIIVLHSTLDPMINKVVDFARKGCASYNEIDWDKAGNIERTKDMSLPEVLAELKGKDTLPKISLQLTDNYSKTTALIFDKNGYLPVRPSEIKLNLPFISPEEAEKLQPQTLKEALEFLGLFQGITDIPVIPTHLILHSNTSVVADKDNVIGILLETGRIIPIKPISLKQAQKDSKLIESEMLYYPETNKLISKYSPENMTPEIRTRLKTINEYRYRNEAFERYKFEMGRFLQESAQKKTKKELEELLKTPNKNLSKIKVLVKNLDSDISSSVSEGTKKLNHLLETSTTLYRTPLLRTPCFTHNKQNCNNDPHCVHTGNKCKLAALPHTDFAERLLDLLRRYPLQRAEIMSGRVPITDPMESLKQEEAEEVLLSGNKIDIQFQKLIAKEKGSIFLETFPDIDIAQPSFEGVAKQSFLIVSPEREAEAQTYSLASVSQQWSSQLGPWFRLVSPLKACDSLYYCFAQLAAVLAERAKNSASGENVVNKNNVFEEEFPLPDPATITLANIREVYSHFLLRVTPENVREIAELELRLPNKEEVERMVDVSDFYNKFQNEEKVDSVDELVERIQRGPPAHFPSLFDVIWMGVMLDIKIILLRKSISELIGNEDVLTPLYGVFFYEGPSTGLAEEECIRFYLLQKSGVAVVSGMDSTIRKLIPSS